MLVIFVDSTCSYGNSFKGGDTYEKWCDLGGSATSSAKVDNHFIFYLQHQQGMFSPPLASSLV